MPELSLNFKVARRAMSMIAQQGKLGFLDTIGLSYEDFNKVTGDVPWIPGDRNRVTAAFNTLMSGMLDSCGLPRFSLPAEYVAACISMYVADINIPLICSYIERPGSIADLGRGNEEYQPCSASQLYALIVDMHGSDEHTAARQQFEKNTKLQLQSAIIEEDNKKKGK